MFTGQGALSMRSLNAAESALPSWTSGVSIHDMWADPTSTPMVGDLKTQRVRKVLDACLGEAVRGEAGCRQTSGKR